MKYYSSSIRRKRKQGKKKAKFEKLSCCMLDSWQHMNDLDNILAFFKWIFFHKESIGFRITWSSDRHFFIYLLVRSESGNLLVMVPFRWFILEVATIKFCSSWDWWDPKKKRFKPNKIIKIKKPTTSISCNQTIHKIILIRGHDLGATGEPQVWLIVKIWVRLKCNLWWWFAPMNIVMITSDLRTGMTHGHGNMVGTGRQGCRCHLEMIHSMNMRDLGPPLSEFLLHKYNFRDDFAPLAHYSSPVNLMNCSGMVGQLDHTAYSLYQSH